MRWIKDLWCSIFIYFFDPKVYTSLDSLPEFIKKCENNLSKKRMNELPMKILKAKAKKLKN